MTCCPTPRWHRSPPRCARACGRRCECATPAPACAPTTRRSAPTSSAASPNVPRSLASPLYRRRSLVLQLDLARVHALLPECPLPRRGLLHLLHDVDARDDAAAFSLAVVATDEPLRREPGPKFSYRARPLTLEREPTLPDTRDPELEQVEFPDDDEVAYEAWYAGRGALRRPPTHRLLGWPDWVQDQRLPEPPAPARGWRLLVQVDSAGDGLDWGDSGCLYVLVPDLDLVAGRLDRAHFLVQSC